MSVASALRIQRAINARRAERGFGAMTVATGGDFLRGGSPTFARAFDGRGSLVCTIQRTLEHDLFRLKHIRLSGAILA